MKRTFLFTLLTFVCISNSNLAWAWNRPIIRDWGDNWHPPRARILVHNTLPLGHGFERNFHFVAPEAFDHLSLHAFAGLGMHLGDGVVSEPTVGWDFEHGEPILSWRQSIYTNSELWPTQYLDIEWQPQSKTLYGLFHSQFWVPTSYFDAGVEAEAWLAPSGDPTSWGFGPNIRFHLRAQQHRDSKLHLEVALYYRELGDVWKPELYLRLHLVPDLKELF